MNTIIENNKIELKGDEDIIDNENLINASSLLSLMHGKSDSICKFFSREIIVNVNQISMLNAMILEKLSLHNVSAITTSVDVSYSDKKTITFKTFNEFKDYNFLIKKSTINSIFIQWEFFIKLQQYENLQRHSVSVRISSYPRPSEFFKVVLNGGFDEENSIDMRMNTTICRVDFINNSIAEELINVVAAWTEVCICAISKKSKFTKFLYKNRYKLANLSELCIVISITLIISILIKYSLNNQLFVVSNEILFFALISIIPLNKLANYLSNYFGKFIYDKFNNLMDIHIFDITQGDKDKN